MQIIVKNRDHINEKITQSRWPRDGLSLRGTGRTSRGFAVARQQAEDVVLCPVRHKRRDGGGGDDEQAKHIYTAPPFEQHCRAVSNNHNQDRTPQHQRTNAYLASVAGLDDKTEIRGGGTWRLGAAGAFAYHCGRERDQISYTSTANYLETNIKVRATATPISK